MKTMSLLASEKLLQVRNQFCSVGGSACLCAIIDEPGMEVQSLVYTEYTEGINTLMWDIKTLQEWPEDQS